jgi:hypothetical protein
MKTPIYRTLAFLLLTTAGIQAQNFDEPKKVTVPDEKSATEKVVENRLSNSTDSSEKVFYENAKRAELTEEKTQQLLKIIQERNIVLKDLENKKKQADASFSIQDPGTLYNFKINQARNQYAKKISRLLTYNQYCYFIVDTYREEAKEDSRLEFFQLLKSNPDLTKEQKLKLYKPIYSYHLNQLLTTAYFSFDKNLQKPKLGVLRFNFEKEFAKICQENNIKTAEPKEANSNNFQWN